MYTLGILCAGKQRQWTDIATVGRLQCRDIGFPRRTGIDKT